MKNQHKYISPMKEKTPGLVSGGGGWNYLEGLEKRIRLPRIRRRWRSNAIVRRHCFLTDYCHHKQQAHLLHEDGQFHLLGSVSLIRDFKFSPYNSDKPEILSSASGSVSESVSRMAFLRCKIQTNRFR
jgi:hypothetical protein